MAGIMNKDYSKLPLQKGNTNLFQYSNNTAFNEFFNKQRTPTSYFPQKGLQFSNEQSKNDFTRLRPRACICKVQDASDITQGTCKV